MENWKAGRVGPFIIDESEYRCSLVMNDEELENLSTAFSSSLTSSSHERGASIWNHEQVESLKHLGFQSSHDNNASLLFGGIGEADDDSFKFLNRETSDMKETSGLQTPNGNVNDNSSITSAAMNYLQVNSVAAAASASQQQHHQQSAAAPSCFPTFTPRSMMPAPPLVFNPQQSQLQQQQHRIPSLSIAPPPLPPIVKAPAPPKMMTAGEFHLTRFGSYRLSVSPPDSLMANIDEDDEEKIPGLKK